MNKNACTSKSSRLLPRSSKGMVQKPQNIRGQIRIHFARHELSYVDLVELSYVFMVRVLDNALFNSRMQLASAKLLFAANPSNTALVFSTFNTT